MKSPLSCLLLLFVLPVQAQVRQAWVHRYAATNSANSRPVAMALDGHGKVIIGGNGFATGGSANYLVAKLTAGGVMEWTSEYAPTNADTVGMRAMALTDSGKVVVTGHPATVKISASGVQEWALPSGGGALVVDAGETNYITGLPSQDFVTVKIAPDGSNIWTRTYNYRGLTDVPTAIALDPSGNIFVGGSMDYVCEINTCYRQFGLVKYSISGDQEWAVAFPFYGSEPKREVRQVNSIRASAANIVLAANDRSNGDGFVVAAFGSSGEQQSYGAYTFTLNFGGLTGVAASIYEGEQNVIVTGSRWKAFVPRPIGTVAYQTIKATSSGQLIWSNQYVGPTGGYHLAKAIAQDATGNVYVTGQSPGIGTGNDYATIKYSPDGQELWVQRYDGPAHGDDVATAIAVAPDGSVYVTGWSTTSSNLIEITTIKYVQSPSVVVDTNRTVSLQFPGMPGASNRVQATTDFLGWLDLGFSVADTNGVIRFIDTNAPSHSFRFYRTVSP